MNAWRSLCWWPDLSDCLITRLSFLSFYPSLYVFTCILSDNKNTKRIRRAPRRVLRSPDPNDSKIKWRLSSPKIYLGVIFSWRFYISFSRDISQIVEKCPTSQCWRILRKFVDPETEADDFQNLICSPLSTEYISIKIFIKRSDQYSFTQVANSQTDRQTDKRPVKHDRLGRGHIHSLTPYSPRG